MIMTLALLLAFGGLLFYAAISDIRALRIPNWLSLSVAGLFCLYLVSLYLEGPGPGNLRLYGSFICAAILFLIGMVLFAARQMGGGDVKLISAVALWAGPALVAQFIFVMSLCGGLMAFFFWLRSRRERNSSECFEKTDSEKATQYLRSHYTAEIPYGVAIALGGFFVLWQLSVNSIR